MHATSTPRPMPAMTSTWDKWAREHTVTLTTPEGRTVKAKGRTIGEAVYRAEEKAAKPRRWWQRG